MGQSHLESSRGPPQLVAGGWAVLIGRGGHLWAHLLTPWTVPPNAHTQVGSLLSDPARASSHRRAFDFVYETGLPACLQAAGLGHAASPLRAWCVSVVCPGVCCLCVPVSLKVFGLSSSAVCTFTLARRKPFPGQAYKTFLLPSQLSEAWKRAPGSPGQGEGLQVLFPPPPERALALPPSVPPPLREEGPSKNYRPRASPLILKLPGARA